jgi:GAF domain-containing protein/HAMP domain-containing protein
MPAETQPTLQPAVDHRFVRTVRLLILTPVVGAIFSIGFYGVLAVQQGVWQISLGSVALLLASLFAALAYRAARRGDETAAGRFMVGGIVAAYGLPELFWSGVTIYHALGGSLLIGLAVLVPMRRDRVRLLVPSLLLFVGYVGAVNLLQPVFRYNMQQTPIIITYVALVTALIVAASIGLALRAFRIGTIRTRLLIAFVGLVLLPVASIGGIVSTIGTTSTRQRAADYLRAIGALKIAEVKDWINSLQLDLKVEIARDAELGRLPTLLTRPADSAGYQAAYQGQHTRFQGTIDLRQNFEELMLLDPNGQVILSTDTAQEGKNFATEAFFKASLAGPHVNTPVYVPSLDRFVIYTGAPLRDAVGRVIGVVAGRANLARLSAIMAERAGLGETGETFVIGVNFAVLTALHYPYDSRYMRTTGPVDAIATETNGTRFYDDYRGIPVIGVFQWVPELQVAVIAEQDDAEAFQFTSVALAAVGITMALILVLAVVAALFTTRGIANPIAHLTAAATKVSEGDLTTQAAVETGDEIGTLAATFNQMTAQLRSLIASLETQSQTRIKELRASADVGRAAALVLDPDQLLRTVVNLITERFGFYYTAVFTLDDSSRYAVLREAAGEAGRTLKERHHQLEVGGQSMVGQATAHRKARIALDVGAEAMRFDNPLLPDTRSEIALPLIIGERVLGALDVQSTRAAAFDEARATILQSMADQIAMALSNAEQFEQTNTALQRSRDLYAASQALSAANEPSSVLAALINLIAPDAKRGGLLRFGPRQADGQLSYAEFIAAWVHPDFKDEPVIQPTSIGTRFTPQQMWLVNYVTPDRPFIVPDGNDPALDLPVRALMQRFGGQALAALPLAVGQQILGVLVVGYRTPRQFDADQLQAMQTLTGQAAVVLQNRQAVADTQAALAQLDAVNRRLTGEAWEGFLRRRVASGVRWIGTADRAQQANLPEVAEALSTGQIATRPLNGSGQLGVAVPIKLRDVSIGALRLVVLRKAWNAELRAMLDSIAGHIAQAAENARLIEQTQHTAQREKQIAQAADKIHRASDLGSILRAAVEEVSRIVGVEDVGIQLGADQRPGNGR